MQVVGPAEGVGVGVGDLLVGALALPRGHGDLKGLSGGSCGTGAPAGVPHPLREWGPPAGVPVSRTGEPPEPVHRSSPAPTLGGRTRRDQGSSGDTPPHHGPRTHHPPDLGNERRTAGEAHEPRGHQLVVVHVDHVEVDEAAARPEGPHAHVQVLHAVRRQREDPSGVCLQGRRREAGG